MSLSLISIEGNYKRSASDIPSKCLRQGRTRSLKLTYSAARDASRTLQQVPAQGTHLLQD